MKIAVGYLGAPAAKKYLAVPEVLRGGAPPPSVTSPLGEPGHT